MQRQDLAEFFQEHRAGLAGAVRGILGSGFDVQEVLQESFLRAWRAWASNGEPDDPKAWIFVITLNHSRDLRRRRQRQRDVPLTEDQAMQIEAGDREPLVKMENREALDAARRAIQTLRDAEKEVFLLRTSGGLSYEAIGKALEIPTGTAKTRMRTALLRLRQILAAHAPSSEGQKELA